MAKSKRPTRPARRAREEHFPGVPFIDYEGPRSRNPLAFRHYDPDAKVAGRPMREHLRFAAAYWHVMRNGLADPFGAPTALMPWDDGTDSLDNALRRIPVFFEFLEKCRIDFYCFHDRDVAPEGRTLDETHANLGRVVRELKARQRASGKRLLWGTACLFAHPRYAQGAATSPSADVFAYAASQVRHALEATHALGGKGYVFWGGREGYATLLNTDLAREQAHLARLLHLAVDHARRIGFKGQLYIEPKPREPSTHQYDSDAAACLNFLREHGLLRHFKLNLETNHATLAGHTMEHEMEVALAAGALGSIDANRGDTLLGWDTDQFPTDLYLTTGIMLRVLRMGGFTTGGLNFDAKRRRESHEPVDLFHAHIGGMDAFARGLRIADAILRDGRLDRQVSRRYRSWDSGMGRRIEQGKVTLADLDAYARRIRPPRLESGRQELLENLINDYIR